MIATTIEQSKKLLELGLSPESADMCYLQQVNEGMYFSYPTVKRDDIEKYYASSIPAWSLSALLELMPSEISTSDEWYNKYQIDIRKYDETYQIAYGNNRGLSGSWHDMINTGEKENLIDAAFEMICWLKENKYI